MQVNFNFNSYMLTVAETLKELKHTEAAPKYHRASSISEVEELLQNSTKTSGLQLIIQDDREGRIIDNRAELLIDDKYRVFYVVKNVQSLTMEEREEALDDCETVVKKILSKMFYDMLRADNQGADKDLLFFDRNSVRYQTIGPIGDNYHGIIVMFTVPNTFSYAYNADDWE